LRGTLKSTRISAFFPLKLNWEKVDMPDNLKGGIKKDARLAGAPTLKLWRKRPKPIYKKAHLC